MKKGVLRNFAKFIGKIPVPDSLFGKFKLVPWYSNISLIWNILFRITAQKATSLSNINQLESQKIFQTLSNVISGFEYFLWQMKYIFVTTVN